MIKVIIEIDEERNLTPDNLSVLALQVYNTLDGLIFDMGQFNKIQEMVLNCKMPHDRTWDIKRFITEGRKPKIRVCDYVKVKDRRK